MRTMNLTARTTNIIGIATRLLPGADAEGDHIAGIPAVAICGDAGIVRVAEAGPRTIVQVNRFGGEHTRSFAVSASGAEEFLDAVLNDRGWGQ